jgi:hypothetical protein
MRRLLYIRGQNPAEYMAFTRSHTERRNDY